MNDPPSLLRNDGGNKNNWIKIKLVGTKCNRTAIGARVRVVTGKHSQMDEVHSGTSVMSQSDLRLHFGVGQAKVVDLIEVKWPTLNTPEQGAGAAGKGSKDAAGDPPKARARAKPPDAAVERFVNIECNQILTIKEGSGIVKSEKIRS